jgi:hypothetical protein
MTGSFRAISSSDLHDSPSQNEQYTPYDQTEIIMMFVDSFVIENRLFYEVFDKVYKRRSMQIDNTVVSTLLT